MANDKLAEQRLTSFYILETSQGNRSTRMCSKIVRITRQRKCLGCIQVHARQNRAFCSFKISWYEAQASYMYWRPTYVDESPNSCEIRFLLGPDRRMQCQSTPVHGVTLCTRLTRHPPLPPRQGIVHRALQHQVRRCRLRSRPRSARRHRCDDCVFE